MKKLTTLTIIANLALLIFSPTLPLQASVLASYDWNDGTTQGWAASTSTSNENSRLRFTNIGNGSLQLFGPFFPFPESNSSIPETLMFDLEFTFYEGISNLEDLATARVDFIRSNPRLLAANATIIGYDLDLSGLAFNETRSFSISLEDPDIIERCCISNPFPGFPSVEDTLKDPDFFTFFFQRIDNESQPASGLLDNFIITTKSKIPEPSLLLGLMLIGVLPIADIIYKTRR